MTNWTLKKSTGQTSSNDGHPYLRVFRIDMRVSPAEREHIEYQAKTQGFDSIAQYVRAQAMAGAQTVNPANVQKALLACQYELNRIGNNINQIAHHLNSGSQVDEDMLQSLLMIQEQAEQILSRAQHQDGGP